MKTSQKPASDRVTVTLAPGQREQLEAIAQQNSTTIAFVVRFAIAQWLSKDVRQLRLDFPEVD